MWLGRIVLKIATEVAEGLYNLHTISLFFSIGTITESLQLIELLDEEEGLL